MKESTFRQGLRNDCKVNDFSRFINTLFAMKKLILYCYLLASPMCLFAQTPAYLDVKVMESLEQEPIAMEYHVRINPDLEGEFDLDRDYEAQRKVMRSKIKENEAQLKQFLESNKVKYTLDREESYSISREEMPFTTFKIKVSNKTELDNLITLLRQLNYIEGNVGNKTFPNTENDELVLFEKLYKKARTKAEKMAALMSCSIGKVLEVEDLEQKKLDYYDLIGEADYERMGYEINRNSLNDLTTLAMRFRFELIQK